MGRCALGERRRKKEKRYSSFAIHAVYNRCELGWTLIGIEKKLDDPREFIINTWIYPGYIQIHNLSKVSIKGKDYLFRILVSSLSKCSSLKAYLFLR